MEKMTMCRICLVENVRMNIVVDKDLQELYETLTDIPFVTEDRRPMLACFICFAKLKQCCQLKRKCLEAEELFAQMMNEPNSLINRGQLNVSAGVSHIEGTAVKVEPPDVYEGLDEIIEPKGEQLSEDPEMEWINNRHFEEEDIPAQQLSESDSRDDVPLMEINTKVDEEQEVFRKKQRASHTTQAPIAKKPILKTRRTEQQGVITEELKRTEQSDTKVDRTTENCTFKHGDECEEPSTYRKKCYKNSNKEYIICEISNKSIDSDDSNKNQILPDREKRFKCEICQRRFNKKSDLTRHIRTHTGEKPFKCDICQRRFNKKSDLTKHIRTHTGEKPFKCDICPRRFNVKCDLTKHIRTHTGEKPFKCHICQHCFSQKFNLTSHIRTHTGEKPFKCDICQHCFSQKVNLTSHIRTHTGEKPFKCDVCQRCFTHKTLLARHNCIRTGEKHFK